MQRESIEISQHSTGTGICTSLDLNSGHKASIIWVSRCPVPRSKSRKRPWQVYFKVKTFSALQKRHTRTYNVSSEPPGPRSAWATVTARMATSPRRGPAGLSGAGIRCACVNSEREAAQKHRPPSRSSICHREPTGRQHWVSGAQFGGTWDPRFFFRSHVPSAPRACPARINIWIFSDVFKLA